MEYFFTANHRCSSTIHHFLDICFDNVSVIYLIDIFALFFFFNKKIIMFSSSMQTRWRLHDVHEIQ